VVKFRFRKFFSVLAAVMLLLAIVLPLQPVLAAPSITISPTYGVAGSVINITGDSFNSYLGDQLVFFFDDIEIPDSIFTLSHTSTFTADFLVPNSTIKGTHIISVRKRSGLVISEKKFIVSAPEIVLNQWGGTVGTNVTASCKGFYANAPVTLYYQYNGTIGILGNVMSSNEGEATLQFIIPESPVGKHQVIAGNMQGHSTIAYFNIIPSISISPEKGAVGDQVAVSGTGFEPDSSIDIILSGAKIASTSAFYNGSFNLVFQVPPVKAGIYALEIIESDSRTRWLNFTVDSKITINANGGEVGLKLVVDGTGFGANTAVSIKYDTQEIMWVSTDTTGAFSQSFEVPVSIAGLHFITASDGFNTKQAIFTVESMAPPAPKPSVPKQNSIVEAQVNLDWESVYDPSEPVTYSFQIARTSDFSKPVFERTMLSSSQYTLTAENALNPSRRWTHYYWRVRATDSASNEGDWSEPVAFRVSPTYTLPAWAKAIIGIVGVLLIVMLISIIRKATRPAAKTSKKT
jgi:hypothetical protein